MSALPSVPESTPTPTLETHAWARFVSARHAAEFTDAWLTLLCEKFPTVQQAAVLVESSDGQNFVPIAVWPSAETQMASLGAAVQCALTERRIVVQPSPDAEETLHVATPVSAHEQVRGAVVLALPAPGAPLPSLLRELHWSSAWLSNLLGKRDHDLAVSAHQRSLGVLDAVAISLRHQHFQQALFDVCNDLRRRFDGSRAAIALVEKGEVKLAALSEAATFEKASPLVQAYVAAMSEACDLAQTVEAGNTTEGNDSPYFRAHVALLDRTGAARALSIPVTAQARCIAVLTIERSQTEPFSSEERLWLDTFCSLLSPIVAQRTHAERSSLERLRDEGERALGAIIGPRLLVWKAVAAAVALLVAVLALFPVEYRVSAKTVTEGEVQRVVAAPYEGFLAAGYVRAGDTVSKGQTMAQLDDHDLRVEQARWSSERDQYDNKLREAMAGHDLTAIQVTSAQLREAQAQLDLLDDKLARARVLAPYDGVVVSGDLSQQVGTPLEAGKKLFEVAPLHSYRVILQVDERDIAQVQLGQHGRLVMNGLAGQPMPFTVGRVMPVATAQDGRNFYRVEARLAQETNTLLPGMEGVGKIEIGKRKLGWVLLHTTFDWIRMTLWTWGL
jgi:multidrug efflux pump subunit AcrA (membrane-fusion protein)